MFSSLKNGRTTCIHFLVISMGFLADFPGSYAIQYNRAANFTARTTKKICQLQKKFSEDPAKISRGSMKSFGLCHEIISPVILNKIAGGGNWGDGSNGDNGANKADGGNEDNGASGYSVKWAWLRGPNRPS